MTTLIPRDQILEILERHNDFWKLDSDPPVDTVRAVIVDLRDGGWPDEAAELDALVDRIEAAA